MGFFFVVTVTVWADCLRAHTCECPCLVRRDLVSPTLVFVIFSDKLKEKKGVFCDLKERRQPPLAHKILLKNPLQGWKSVSLSAFKQLPGSSLFGDTWFSPDNFESVSLGSGLQLEVQLIKNLINVNLIGSSSSSQPCQLVKAYLQSLYLCLVLNWKHDKSVAAGTFTCRQNPMKQPPPFGIYGVLMLKPGLDSRECVSEVIITRTRRIHRKGWCPRATFLASHSL